MALAGGPVWQVETVPVTGSTDTGLFTSLALDSAGHPHISFYDNDSHDLMYARYDGSGWQVQTVANGSSTDVGWFTSLALGENDVLHISYYDYDKEDLKYAYLEAAPPGPSHFIYLPIILTSAPTE